MKYKNKIQKAALVLLSVLLSLFTAELVLHFLLPPTYKLHVWQPNLSHTFHPDSTIFYGISSESKFTINSQGFRGEEFRTDSRKKYLCIGGSTTECLYLDDNETWSSMLQSTNQHLMFGNIGKSGCTTRENYLHLKYYTPQLGKINGVIMMVGLNDLMIRLSRDTLFENNFEFTKAVEDSLVNAIFLSNKHQNVWWRKLNLFQLLQNTLHQTSGVEWKNIQDDRGETLKRWRNYRMNTSKVIDSIPALANALKEFEQNLDLIYKESQKQNLELVLVSQGTLYKDSMNSYENSLLWMGGVGNFQERNNCAYYSSRVLNKAMSDYNERLKIFSVNKPGVKFVDLANQLAKDTSVFYDDCHFNENGAKKVAEVISKSLADSKQ